MMEPVSWIIALALLIGGYELLDDDKPEEDEGNTVIVSETKAFKKGVYYKTEDGYFITDLSVSGEENEN